MTKNLLPTRVQVQNILYGLACAEAEPLREIMARFWAKAHPIFRIIQAHEIELMAMKVS